MKKSVWPSAGEPVSSRNAGMKLPPTLFSTKTVVRRFSLIFWATRRAMTSVAPPAASPTRRRIGLPEKSCAWADRADAENTIAHAMRTNAVRRCMSSSLDLFLHFSVFGQQRRHDALTRQWQGANAFAERPRHRIADRRRGGAQRGFAQAQRRLIPCVDEADVDLRNLGEAQDRVALPAVGRDPPAGEANTFLEGPARRLDDAALDLVGRAIRVDHQAGIDGRPDAGETNLLVDLDLGHDRGIGGAVLVAGKAEAARATIARGRADTVSHRGG